MPRMKPHMIQIRECQNPSCHLRYPNLDGGSFGARCPKCLGATVAVWEHEALSKPYLPPLARPKLQELEGLLDNVRSAYNVGSILRSAEGLGLRHLYLAGITPAPGSPKVGKTALGAEVSVSWSYHNNGLDLVRQLRDRGRPVWVLENMPTSKPIDAMATVADGGPVPVLVVGNEQTGVDPGIIELSDERLCIPMVGTKASFNVAIAFALAAYLLTRRVDSASP